MKGQAQVQYPLFSSISVSGCKKRLGLGLRLAFYPDKVGFRNQKVIHKELTAHPNINDIRLLGEIGHFQRLVQGRPLFFGGQTSGS